MLNAHKTVTGFEPEPRVESDTWSDTHRAILPPVTTTTVGSFNNGAASHLNVALKRLSLANRPASEFDNFYTPENVNFYSRRPYFKLDETRHEIRLLKVYPQRKTYSQHIKDHPEWKGRESTMSQDVNSSLYQSRRSITGPPVGRSRSRFQTNQTMRDFTPVNSKPEESVIACELLDKVPLSRVDGRYHALSYCAGSPKNVSKILINGIMFNAFANLEHAIQCALNFWDSRSSNTELLLWADQICINQEDLVERSSQVGMMRDIYLRSQGAIMCTSTKTVYKGWGGQISLKPIVDGNYWMQCETSLQNPTPFDDIDLFVRHQLKSTRSTLKDLPMCIESLCVFLSSPWWSRAWVYQEFIMAPRAYFVYGESTVSWANLSKVLEGVFELGEEKLKNLENNISKWMKESKTKIENEERWANEDIVRSENVWNRERREPILREIHQLESKRVSLVHLQGNARESFEKQIKWSKSDRQLAKQFVSSSQELRIIDNRLRTLDSQLEIPGIGKRPQTINPRQYHLDALHKEHEALRRAQISIDGVLQLLPTLRSLLGPVASFMKGKARQKKLFGLKELLQHSRECQASDPRDKIYAFLGLADQGYGIIPNYTWQNTIVHVLIHTAQRIITCEGNLHILEHVGEGREKLGTLLPSWVPDWTSNDQKTFSRKLKQLITSTRLRNGNEMPFQASKEETGAPEFVRDEFNDSNLDLKVKGIYAGSLTNIDGSLYDNSLIQTFLTPTGLRVHTSRVAAYDDELWVLYGARTPVILRFERGSRYSFLSEALVCEHDDLISGIMFGSMVDMYDIAQKLKQLLFLLSECCFTLTKYWTTVKPPRPIGWAPVDGKVWKKVPRAELEKGDLFFTPYFKPLWESFSSASMDASFWTDSDNTPEEKTEYQEHMSKKQRLAVFYLGMRNVIM